MPTSGKSIRICFAIGSLDVGGTETQVVKLAMSLDRSQFEPTIVCMTHHGVMYHKVKDAGIPVLLLTPPPTAHWPWVYWARELERYLRQERIALAHGFLFPTYSLLAVAAANARTQTVVVAGIRSLGLGREQRWPFSVLERIGNRLTHRIVANAEAVRQACLRRDPRSRDKIDVIYNGVDLLAFQSSGQRNDIRRDLGVSEDDVLVTVVANLIAYKGHRDILCAFQAFRRSRPGAKLALVGAGVEEGNLRVMVENLGLSTDVLFLGLRSDVAGILAATDIMVQGSHQEGFPNAILEAMAAGKPVIATRVGGVPEQVVHSVTGLLVDPGDVPTMTAALCELANDRDLARRMGEAARQRVRELFSCDRTVRQHEELYGSLLG